MTAQTRLTKLIIVILIILMICLPSAIECKKKTRKVKLKVVGKKNAVGDTNVNNGVKANNTSEQNYTTEGTPEVNITTQALDNVMKITMPQIKALITSNSMNKLFKTNYPNKHSIFYHSRKYSKPSQSRDLRPNHYHAIKTKSYQSPLYSAYPAKLGYAYNKNNNYRCTKGMYRKNC